MSKHHDWEGLDQDYIPPKCIEGFIYLIEDRETGYRYIGKKSFWSRVKDTKKSSPTFGKRIEKESNWRAYQSSNKTVADWDNPYKKVLCLCKTTFELSYKEIEILIKSDAILKDRYKNYLIGREPIGKPSSDLRISYTPK